MSKKNREILQRFAKKMAKRVNAGLLDEKQALLAGNSLCDALYPSLYENRLSANAWQKAHLIFRDAFRNEKRALHSIAFRKKNRASK